MVRRRAKDYICLNSNGPELLESLKLQGEGKMAPPPSELTNYNPNAKTGIALYSQFFKLTHLIQLDAIKP